MPDRLLPEPFEYYLRSKQVGRGLRRSTLEEYRRDLKDFCRWLTSQRQAPIHDLTLDDFVSIDRDTARKWLVHLNDRRLAPMTRARRLSTITDCFRWLVSKGLIPHDPFTGLT